MTTLVKRYWTLGDTLPTLGAQLQSMSSTGGYTADDITGYTVKFKMVNEAGATVVAETTVGVTISESTAGKVYMDFSSSQVNTAGKYYGWFMAYSSTERKTYPVDGRKFEINISDPG